ncbi:hypothetical protein BJ546DRAFT_398748 [Cryomyces antarcticus]
MAAAASRLRTHDSKDKHVHMIVFYFPQRGSAFRGSLVGAGRERLYSFVSDLRLKSPMQPTGRAGIAFMADGLEKSSVDLGRCIGVIDAVSTPETWSRPLTHENVEAGVGPSQMDEKGPLPPMQRPCLVESCSSHQRSPFRASVDTAYLEFLGSGSRVMRTHQLVRPREKFRHRRCSKPCWYLMLWDRLPNCFGLTGDH